MALASTSFTIRASGLPTPTQTRVLARWTPFLLAGITAIGFILRVWEIGTKGLWLDEAFSVWLGWKPLGEMLSWLVRIDQHPPLYYALLHFWTKLAGDNPDDVRMLSAILGTLTIPVMFLLGRRLMGTSVGLLAALILALSPFHVRFAQETRMYTLLMLNVSLALLALTWILTNPRRAALTPRRIITDPAWLGYMVFCAAALWSHNTAIFFPLAINLFVLGGMRAGRDKRTELVGGLCRPSHKSWLFAQTGVFMLWLPWLIPLFIQSTGVYREFWVPYPTWQTVADTLKAFLSAMLPAKGWLATGIWIAFGSLIMLGVWCLRQTPSVLKLLLVIFLTPLIGEWVAGLWRPIFDDRTLIWITLPLYLLLASGIAQLRYRPTILVAVAILVAVNLVSLRQYYTSFVKEEWDKAAAYVGERAEKDDMLLFNATWVQIPFDYYFRYQDRSVTKHGAPVDLFDRGILEPKMAESDLPRLHELIADHERVWLIYSHNWYTDPQNLIPTALSQDLKLLDQHQFSGLEVQLYGKP
jgi:mannosyltransferase